MGFPARLAAIDIGSNAIRFVAARFEDEQRYRIIEQLRLPVRLGRSAFDRGYLSDQEIDAAVEALLTIAAITHDLTLDGCRAVATSALRESRNAQTFVERTREKAAIDIDVIGGDEEARLVYLAARHKLHLGNTPHLLVDIGGGSMEIAAIDGEAMRHVESYRAGALRFAGIAGAAGDDAAKVGDAIDAFVDEIGDSPVFATHFHAMVASGGSIDALARIIGIKPDDRGVMVLDRLQLSGAIDQLSALDYAGRAQTFKLPPDRADVILPAALLYERLARRAEVDRILAPQAGVKEGVLLDMAAQVARAPS